LAGGEQLLAHFYFLLKYAKVGRMDAETKKLLQENIEISKENNQLLKKMVRNQRWTNVYRVVYWSIIILSSVGAYYFIQPFLGNLLNIYSGGTPNDSSVNVGDVLKNLSNKQQMEDLLKAFQQ
jgi:hypothetical protein